MVNTFKLLLLSATTLFPFTALGQIVLTFAGENSWPPFAKEDGSGISRVLIEKAMQQVGVDVKFVIVPYARALKMVEQGSVDGAYNVTKQPSTEQKYLFGNESLFSTNANYYYKQERIQSYQSANDIPTGASIAVIIGYEYGEVYEKNRARFNEIRVAHQSQIIQLIEQGKVDLGIMFEEVYDYTIKTMPPEQPPLAKGHVNHSSDIYVAFSPLAEGVDEKMRLLDKGLHKVKQTHIK